MQFKHRKKIVNTSVRNIETKNGIYMELYVHYKTIKLDYVLCERKEFKILKLTEYRVFFQILKMFFTYFW